MHAKRRLSPWGGTAQESLAVKVLEGNADGRELAVVQFDETQTLEM